MLYIILFLSGFLFGMVDDPEVQKTEPGESAQQADVCVTLLYLSGHEVRYIDENGEYKALPPVILNRNATLHDLQAEIRKMGEKILSWEQYQIPEKCVRALNLSVKKTTLPGERGTGEEKLYNEKLCFNPLNLPSELPVDMEIKVWITAEQFAEKMMGEEDHFSVNISRPSLENVTPEDVKRVMRKNPLIWVDNGKFAGILILNKDDSISFLYPVTSFPGNINVEWNYICKVLNIFSEQYLRDVISSNQYQSFLQIFYALGIITDVAVPDFLKIYFGPPIEHTHRRRRRARLANSLFQEMYENGLVLNDNQFFTHKDLFRVGDHDLKCIWDGLFNESGDTELTLNCSVFNVPDQLHCKSIYDLKKILRTVLRISQNGCVKLEFQSGGVSEAIIDPEGPPKSAKISRIGEEIRVVAAVTALAPCNAKDPKTINVQIGLPRSVTLDNIDEIFPFSLDARSRAY